MLAVCRWFARSQFDSDKYKLTVYVNNFLAKELEIDQSAPTQSIDIPADLLKRDQPEQRVRFELVGRGRFRFIGFPLKIRGGTASPIRAVAIFE